MALEKLANIQKLLALRDPRADPEKICEMADELLSSPTKEVLPELDIPAGAEVICPDYEPPSYEKWGKKFIGGISCEDI